MKQFRFSILLSVLCLIGAFVWGYAYSDSISGATPLARGLTALWVAGILGVLELSLSFDNAVVNAKVLKTMPPFWQKIFLTVGILIAVVGMRFILPIAIVALASGEGMIEVVHMAFAQPLLYAEHLHQSHDEIAAFGGVFLLMVFLDFLLDGQKEAHWLKWIEKPFALMGRLQGLGIGLILAILLLLACFWAPDAKQAEIMVAGIVGLLIYVVLQSLNQGLSELGGTVKRAAWISFVYLEILDASFSLDGVVGAFAISQDVVLIMLGLAIGAFFVRSLTLFLVRKEALENFVYLEHGAHYAIGALALVMLLGLRPGFEAPEWFTGLMGAALILLSIWSSMRSKHSKKS